MKAKIPLKIKREYCRLKQKRKAIKDVYRKYFVGAHRRLMIFKWNWNALRLFHYVYAKEVKSQNG